MPDAGDQKDQKENSRGDTQADRQQTAKVTDGLGIINVALGLLVHDDDLLAVGRSIWGLVTTTNLGRGSVGLRSELVLWRLRLVGSTFGRVKGGRIGRH